MQIVHSGVEPKRELLLTGHEDGTVRFWDAGGVTLTSIYKFSTAQLFTGDDLEGCVQITLTSLKNTNDYLIFVEVPPPQDTEDAEEEWPPFRKTGVFDPYSDDPRLAIKRVRLLTVSVSASLKTVWF